jgi:hypothetical protein
MNDLTADFSVDFSVHYDAHVPSVPVWAGVPAEP